LFNDFIESETVSHNLKFGASVPNGSIFEGV
jgi:hypothetical protein